MFAIINSGGKQYKVKKGAKVRMDRLKGEPGTKVDFNEVLLVSDDEDTKIGTPYLKGANVSGVIKRQDRAKKIVVFKYIRRKNSSKKIGHRQHFTELEITDINY